MQAPCWASGCYGWLGQRDEILPCSWTDMKDGPVGCHKKTSWLVDLQEGMNSYPRSPLHFQVMKLTTTIVTPIPSEGILVEGGGKTTICLRVYIKPDPS